MIRRRAVAELAVVVVAHAARSPVLKAAARASRHPRPASRCRQWRRSRRVLDRHRAAPVVGAAIPELAAAVVTPAAGPAGVEEGASVRTRADGSDRRQLTSGSEVDKAPVWSPDGARSPSVGSLRTGRRWRSWTRMASRCGSSTSAQLPIALEGCVPHASAWSPDGEWLAFTQAMLVARDRSVRSRERSGSGHRRKDPRRRRDAGANRPALPSLGTLLHRRDGHRLQRRALVRRRVERHTCGRPP